MYLIIEPMKRWFRHASSWVVSKFFNDFLPIYEAFQGASHDINRLIISLAPQILSEASSQALPHSINSYGGCHHFQVVNSIDSITGDWSLGYQLHILPHDVTNVHRKTVQLHIF